MQLESMDCGPACIQMIAAFYGKHYSLRTLKLHCNVTRVGVTAKDVTTGCDAIGLKNAVVQIFPRELERLPLPAILYWRQNHYVVLYKMRKKRGKTLYYIADPSYRKVVLQEEAFMRDWLGDEKQGIALLLEPTEAFFEKPAEKRAYGEEIKKYLGIFREVLRKHRRGFLQVGLLTVIIALLNWAMPFFMQNAVDRGIGGQNMPLVMMLLLSQLFFFLGYSLSSALNNVILTRIGFRISVDFLTRYLYKLIRLPISFFDTKLNTDLIQRMDDQRRMENFLTGSMTSIFLSLVNFVVFSAILLYYNIFIFLIFLFFSFASTLYTRRFLDKLMTLNYARFTVSADSKNVVYELINGMTEIKINSAQASRISKWEKIQHALNAVTLRSLFTSLRLSTGTSFLSKLSDIIVMIGCAYFVIQEEMTIGIMMTILYILGQLSGATSSIIGFITSAQETKLALDRIDDIYQRPDEDNERKTAPPVPLRQGLRLSGVSFKYPGSFNPFVLHHVDLTIPAGKVTAIVGASGSGKTTLMKLLLSFYYPQQGEIFLDDDKLSGINAEAWRRNCGVVMQDGYIFSGTIAENIALADEQPDMERVRKAAEIACLNDFVESIPMQYNTKIGKAGMGLSGGQTQRILIARAVYENPDFIFFDEATSSLDAHNERQIMQNLSSFYQGKTVIIIAHRLSTVSNADNIIFMDNGRIVEQGDHETLTMAKGAYYKLIKNQLELGK